jgi:hypothetical protein
MQKWGLIRLELQASGDGQFSFEDLAVVRQADDLLAEGMSFRAVVRKLVASRSGQLAFDFRLEAQPAKVLQLTRRETLRSSAPDPSLAEGPTAEVLFHAASQIDQDDPEHLEEASAASALTQWIQVWSLPSSISRIFTTLVMKCTGSSALRTGDCPRTDVFEAYSIWAMSFMTLGVTTKPRHAIAAHG